MRTIFQIGQDAAQRRVVEVLQDSVRTWSQLQVATNLNDDFLGLALAELFTLRRIRTRDNDGVRTYWLRHV